VQRPSYLSDTDIAAQVRQALAEDIGPGDLTAQLIPAAETVTATLLCRDAAVVCGVDWVIEVFRQLDPGIRLDWRVADGERVPANTVLLTLQGPARAILSGERCALNFLQTLSGVATTTADYVQAVAGTRTRILDTRKTIPGLRLAQKYAVLCGGGSNHRIGLYDAVLIKENHIAAAGSIAAAVAQARAINSQVMVEVEVETLEELQEALQAQVDRVMLDNMSLATMRQAVAMTDGQVELEASGGVAIERLREIAASGVDFISVGALTKHLRAIDLSLRFAPPADDTAIA